MRGGTFTDAYGTTRPLRDEDFMVVAPYNAQVQRLRLALPPGIRIGTVDKFQGQEAPIVFFSMATSSGEDVPRSLDVPVLAQPAERRHLESPVPRGPGLLAPTAGGALPVHRGDAARQRALPAGRIRGPAGRPRLVLPGRKGGGAEETEREHDHHQQVGPE